MIASHSSEPSIDFNDFDDDYDGDVDDGDGDDADVDDADVDDGDADNGDVDDDGDGDDDVDDGDDYVTVCLGGGLKESSSKELPLASACQQDSNLKYLISGRSW